jgi:hypothetical protein
VFVWSRPQFSDANIFLRDSSKRPVHCPASSDGDTLSFFCCAFPLPSAAVARSSCGEPHCSLFTATAPHSSPQKFRKLLRGSEQPPSATTWGALPSPALLIPGPPITAAADTAALFFHGSPRAPTQAPQPVPVPLLEPQPLPDPRLQCCHGRGGVVQA